MAGKPVGSQSFAWESVATKMMSMSDAVWRRHANPWSAWTRVATAPLWFLAIWSAHWIGWHALWPIAALSLWTWLNPRIFPEPKRTTSWASRAVLGERVWLARRETPIPRHHQRAVQVSHALSLALLPVAVWGFVTEDFWPAMVGWHGIVAAKMWFLDRMVWLFEDMKDAKPEYRAWLYDETAPIATG